MEHLETVVLRNDDEAGRLSALHSYELHIEDASATLFQDLVGLAQTLVCSKMAFMSLVEENRQWFKASVGLDAKETPRNIAFCDLAIRSNEVLVILDAANDPRFADNPLVTGPPYIRFYAGAPIIDSDGFALGTICLSDPEPREEFAFADSLAVLARHAAALLGLRRKLLQHRRAVNLVNDQRDRLWDNSLDMMLIVRIDGQIIAGNPAWEEKFGAIGENDKTHVSHHFDEAEDAFPTRMESGQRNVIVDHQMRDRDNNLLFVNWNLARDGDLIFGIGRDLTQERATQVQLAHAQRMESIGQLTGGIAHDFNNLLTIVMGNLDIAERRIGNAQAAKLDQNTLESELNKALDSINKAHNGAQRAATLTQRLLAFSRRQSLRPEIIQPDALINDLEPLVRQALDERFTLEISTPDEIAAVEIDAGQLENAILNLVVNARDSLQDNKSGNGRVELKLSEIKLSQEESQTLDDNARPGRYVKICVSDNGTGIAPDVASKIFEPFFTTKEVGRGTGLGLSQVHGFVLQSGGFVTLETALGKGTTVSIWLPASQKAAPVTPPEPLAKDAPRQADQIVSGTILLVEDNADLRAHIASLLAEHGFDIVQAVDGLTAQAILSSDQPKPDLVLSDITMPRMDGYQLAQFIAREKFDIPVILMTGYAASNVPDDCGFVTLVTKPFSSDEIIDVVCKKLSDKAIAGSI
jgi:signal transduction histidine kinase/ActR/RegA family two-component response regulator